MKTIGLLGGMSWESTVTYYQQINRVIKEELGGLHSAKCVLYSVDFYEIERLQAAGQWEKSGIILSEAAQALERAGADFLIICTNTMHKLAPMIQQHINIPILHIAEVTAGYLLKDQIEKVILLGTKYTMEQEFYKSKLIEKGITVLIPDQDGIETVNQIIYQELCQGKVLAKSRKEFIAIIEKLADFGGQGVIFGCTEIGLLLSPQELSIPVYDTAILHARAAVMESLFEMPTD